MLIISYDISDSRLRTRFSKFIRRFGERIQFSVYSIENSKRILDIISAEITGTYEPRFEETDSVMIFKVDDSSIIRMGYAKHEDEDIIII